VNPVSAEGFTPQNIQLLAGMQRGLPLATAALNNNQTGIILQGQILQAFGNWQGVNQTLDLISQGAPLPPTDGISFTWSRGQPLSAAIAASLQQALPAYTYSINISNSLFAPGGATQAGTYPSLETFAQYLKDISQPLGAQFAGESYSGVSISMRGQTIYVLDSASPSNKTVQLIFQDLTGQPTWIDVASVSFKTVPRADISVGDQVIFPTGVIAPYVLTSQAAAFPGAPSRSKSLFQGRTCHSGTSALVFDGLQHFRGYHNVQAEEVGEHAVDHGVYPRPLLDNLGDQRGEEGPVFQNCAELKRGYLRPHISEYLRSHICLAFARGLTAPAAQSIGSPPHASNQPPDCSARPSRPRRRRAASPARRTTAPRWHRTGTRSER
jgi:hypothetical protein